MRIFLLLWFVPLVLFWGWYGLSYHDINFGIRMFTRELHDLVFIIYGNAIGIEPEKVPGIAAWACFFDSLIVLSIAAFRWRAKWWPRTKAMLADLSRSYWNDDTSETVSDYPVPEYEVSASGRVNPAE